MARFRYPTTSVKYAIDSNLGLDVASYSYSYSYSRDPQEAEL